MGNDKNTGGEGSNGSSGDRDYDLVPSSTPVFSFAFLKRSFSIRGILGRVWHNRAVFFCVLSLFFAIGLYQARVAGPRFVASIDILPAEVNIGDNSSTNGAVGGLLGSLTGSDITGAQIPEFIKFQAALSSDGVAKLLDKRYDLRCRTFRGLCDPKTHTWKRLTGWRAWLAGLTARLQGLPDPNGARTTADLADYILGNVVSVKQKTGVVTMSIEDRDPKFAAAFIWELWRGTNDYLKEQNRQVRRDYLAYLDQRIKMTTSLAQREAIQNLLLEQERRLMQSAANVPYAAAILDGPRIMPVNRVIRTMAIYIFLGLLAGGLVALFVPKNLFPFKRPRSGFDEK